MCGIWGVFGLDDIDDVKDEIGKFFEISSRGPDSFRVENLLKFSNCVLGFHRLAIIGDQTCMQPIHSTAASLSHIHVACNGEIYNYKDLKDKYGFEYSTQSDIESIIHLYDRAGIEFACQNLYGVFAFILVDTKRCNVYIARDTFGVRPAFKLTTSNGMLTVCSEAKGILDAVKNSHKRDPIKAIEPGTLEEYKLIHKSSFKNGQYAFMFVLFRFVRKYKFHEIGRVPMYNVQVKLDPGEILSNIRKSLTNAVRVRLMSQRRIGCLLSGGLDSSLIAGLMMAEARQVGTTIDYPIQTFSVGMSDDSPDLVAARRVAHHLKSEHHEVIFSARDAFKSIRAVIRAIESYDITTIRASIGMYLLAKYIRENTDTVVIFSGEGADEVCQGYIYFYKAPTSQASYEESLRLCKDLYLFDVCRADRTTAAHGLEIRVPFLDHFFTSYYLSLRPQHISPISNPCEKYLLRKAFDGLGVIPQDILWRTKEAFSDGVASKKKSLFQHLKEFIDPLISDEQFKTSYQKYPFNTPQTKEAYYYREIFTELYPNCDHFTPYMWLPKWCGDVKDPSARTLDHYNTQQNGEDLNLMN